MIVIITENDLQCTFLQSFQQIRLSSCEVRMPYGAGVFQYWYVLACMPECVCVCVYLCVYVCVCLQCVCEVVAAMSDKRRTLTLLAAYIKHILVSQSAWRTVQLCSSVFTSYIIYMISYYIKRAKWCARGLSEACRRVDEEDDIESSQGIRRSLLFSVCCCVCWLFIFYLSHAGIVSKRRHVARCSLHCQIAKCVQFCGNQKIFPRDDPFPPEILAQTDLPPPDSSES